MSDAPGQPRQTDLRVFLFTDIVGSTDLKQRLGDAAAIDLLARHDALFRRLLGERGGDEENHTGDGFLASFEAPSEALRCALEFQRELGALGGPEPLSVRIGLHLGEIIRRARPESEQIAGLAVDTAARVMSLAEGRQILMTRAAFDSARQHDLDAENGEPVQWRAHGTYRFQGVEDPLEIFEVGVEGVAPLRPPPDPEEARRLDSPEDEATLGWRPGANLAIPHRSHWVLREMLGEGGYGEVWLATHDKTREPRIFKFCFQADRLRSLKREVILFRLLKETLGNRRDITRILDWQFERPPFYLESEYSEGGDLSDWAERRGGIDKISLAERLEAVAQTAGALAAAHSVGVLHKDIKPANILIEEDAERGDFQVRLTDFGIGLITDRAILEAKGITSAGLTATAVAGADSSGSGTRLYMAPEVLEGKASTTLSDIYALGVVLYQMVSGDLSRALAPGWERDVADDLLREDIAACAEGRPERRLQVASELAERLSSLEARRAERERADRDRREAESAARLVRLARRRRRQFITISSVGLAITIAATLFALREFRLRRAEESARYVTQIQNAATRIDEGNPQQAREMLLSAPSDLRGWEWKYLVNKTSRSTANTNPVAIRQTESGEPASALWKDSTPGEVVRRDHQSPSYSAAFDLKGGRILIASQDGVTLHDAENLQPLERIEGVGIAPAFAGFSGDDTFILTGDVTGILSILDTRTKLYKPYSVQGFTHISEAFLSPDESLAAVAYYDGAILVWDIRADQRMATFSGHTSKVTALRFMPDDPRVLSASADGSIRTWDLQTEKEVSSPQYPPGDRRAGPHFFIPGGSRVVSAREGGSILIWDLATGKAEHEFDADVNSQSRGAFSPDGSVFAATAGENQRAVILWDTSTWEELGVLRGHTREIADVTFGPSGSRIVTASEDRTTRIWAPLEAGASNTPTLANAHEGVVFQAAFSPAGDRFVTASYDKTVKIWDSASRQLLGSFEEHEHEVIKAAFSVDGRLVISVDIGGVVRAWVADTRVQEYAMTPSTDRFLQVVDGVKDGRNGKLLDFFFHHNFLALVYCRISPDRLDRRSPGSDRL